MRSIGTSAILLILIVILPHASAGGFDSAVPGQLSWTLSLGAGAQKGAGSNFHTLTGVGMAVGIGANLSLAITPTYCGVVASGRSGGSYLIDLPLSLNGHFAVSAKVKLAIGGGIGIGFSDMREWSKSNRALTGHLGVSVSLYDRQSSNIATELRLVKASTSTGNATLGYLLLRYAIAL